jgi:hypothetical protein
MKSDRADPPDATVRRIVGWASVTLMVGALACWGGFHLIGQEIDAEGFLHEPFALIPLGWLCAFGALGTGVAYALMGLARTRGRR